MSDLVFRPIVWSSTLSGISAYHSRSLLGSYPSVSFIQYHSYYSLIAINDCPQAVKPSTMSFPRFWRWRTNRSPDYRSLDTAALEMDEKSGAARGLLRRSNSTSSLSSASASKHYEYHTRSTTHPFSSTKAYIIIATNIFLFLTSISLFIALPYMRPLQLNHVYRQVSTWCKASIYIPYLSQLHGN